MKEFGQSEIDPITGYDQSDDYWKKEIEKKEMTDEEVFDFVKKVDFVCLARALDVVSSIYKYKTDKVRYSGEFDEAIRMYKSMMTDLKINISVLKVDIGYNGVSDVLDILKEILNNMSLFRFSLGDKDKVLSSYKTGEDGDLFELYIRINELVYILQQTDLFKRYQNLSK